MTTGRSICLLESDLEEEYENFLCEISGSTVYYSSSYRRFLIDLLGCNAEYYLAVEGGRIKGVLPLMFQEGPYGRVINSLPYFGSNGGVMACSEWARQALVESFIEIANRPSIAAATIVSHPLYPNANFGVPYDVTDDRVGQISRLDGLAGSEATLLSRIDGSARRNIKKAKRAGVEVKVTPDAIRFLEGTHNQNMLEIGGKAKSHAFFSGIPNHFAAGRDYDIYVAEREGQPLAALLVLYFNRTVEYFTPATCLEAREIQPMALILCQAMLDAAARGFTRWNWGGTWKTQEGVYRFKKKWAAQDHPYKYFIKINEPTLLGARKEDLLAGYPDFYLLPFERLRENLGSLPNNE